IFSQNKVSPIPSVSPNQTLSCFPPYFTDSRPELGVSSQSIFLSFFNSLSLSNPRFHFTLQISPDPNHDIAVLQAEPQHKFNPPLSSSTYFSDGSLSRVPDSLTESETVNWKVIAARDFGSAELVSCLVLDI
ncbi:hypothetical protein ES288_A08G121500v1, partial [Gossypium darwinii]